MPRTTTTPTLPMAGAAPLERRPQPGAGVAGGFLLAEASETAELESVSVDGEVVLVRMLGEAVNVAKLKRSASFWLEPSGGSTAEAIIELFDALSVVSQVDDAMLPESIAEHCGCSEELVYRLKAARPCRPSDEAGAVNREENWLEGFEDDDC